MRASGGKAKWLGALLGMAMAAAAAGAGLPRLPPKSVMPKGDGSPGPVVFDHQTHVDEEEPNCLACHPGKWGILEKGKAMPPPPLKHAAMDKGQACGACHGKGKAFGLKKCDLCHRDE